MQLVVVVLMLVTAILLGANPRIAFAHDVYLMNDNHTDYGWNASTKTYDASLARELDYYLEQIDRTKNNPPESQARFNADGWWYLKNYESQRSPSQFQKLLGTIRSGHITVPLNPFVMLYGAVPTEAAIRAGYYPGRMARKHGIKFRLAQYIENHTAPWGLASIWAGSGVEFTWKGVCGCATQTPFREHKTDVFVWRGPDGRDIIKKWYEYEGGSTYGGYAEARSLLRFGGIKSPMAINSVIRRTESREPRLPVTGLFGGGSDDVEYKTRRFVYAARVLNGLPAWLGALRTKDRVIVSNGIDYFEAIKPYTHRLPVLRGGWGIDWDLLPARFSHWTTRVRNAVERLRSAEMLMVLAMQGRPQLWQQTMPRIQAAYVDVFKYFEHSWNGTSKQLSKELFRQKKAWVESFESAVAEAEEIAASALSLMFETGGKDRVVVVNPLGFARTDYADLPMPNGDPVRVVDLVSGETMPSQTIIRANKPVLRFLARDVPGLGYRQYKLAPGAPASIAPAAVIEGGRIESDLYAVETGQSGEIVRAFDKQAGRDIVGKALNLMSEGRVVRVVAENVGPVSATLRLDVEGTPRRRVRLTLFREIARIEIDNEILGRPRSEVNIIFDFGFKQPGIHFEEVGAIARPGLVPQGGNFLPGTNAKYMTLNHFVNFGDLNYNVTLSNWDAFAMRFGQSTPQRFDLPTQKIGVLAVGEAKLDQGGADSFVNRFALAGRTERYSGVSSMQLALAHQNPLKAIFVPRNQFGSMKKPHSNLVRVDGNNVVVVAFKPAEEAERGYIVRVWELEGRDVRISVDVSSIRASQVYETNLIETDENPLILEDGWFTAQIPANAMKTFRLVPATAASKGH